MTALRRQFGRCLLAATCALAPASAQVASDAPVRVVGYNDMDEMLPALAAAYRRDLGGPAFDFILKSTRSAPPALIDGSSAFAPMGAEFTPEDLANYARVRGGEPVMIPVAHDSLKPGTLSSPTGVLVNAANPLQQISLRQLRALFAPATTPQVVKWRDLGMTGNWAGRSIKPLGLSAETAIGARMLRRTFSGGTFTPVYRGFAQSRDVAAAVAADPDMIGLANLNVVRPGVRALALVDDRGVRHSGDARDIMSGTYPLDRHLLIYARRGRDGCVEPIARDFLRYALSARGQAIIASGTRGYLPLNPRERLQARQLLDRCVTQ